MPTSPGGDQLRNQTGTIITFDAMLAAVADAIDLNASQPPPVDETRAAKHNK